VLSWREAKSKYTLGGIIMESFLMTATKEFSWDCAHVLTGHQGLCKNLHGHTYKMEVTACQKDGLLIEEGPSQGMVIDFKDLKQLVNSIIVEPFDHATVIDMSNDDPFEAGLYHLLRTHDKKIVKVQYRPTAENMCLDFVAKLNAEVDKLGLSFAIAKIRLYETPTSYAEVLF
jgi:6-pyruvoyltetrahydropterin/6-carboxytetrahydropterin synthase